MTSGLTERERKAVRQIVKPVVFEILALPWAMIIELAVVLGGLASLAGLPGAELAWGFILETAEPVVVLQAKMLAAVGAIGALCFVAGRYRIGALVYIVADRLKTRASRLASFWLLTFTGVGPLIGLQTAPAVRVPAEAITAGARAGFVAGESPQLE